MKLTDAEAVKQLKKLRDLANPASKILNINVVAAIDIAIARLSIGSAPTATAVTDEQVFAALGAFKRKSDKDITSAMMRHALESAWDCKKPEKAFGVREPDAVFLYNEIRSGTYAEVELLDSDDLQRRGKDEV